MSKIKILALSTIVVMLFACGSQDGSPPELRNKQLGTITLIAEFDSEIIGVGDLTKENIIAESHVNWRPIYRESLAKESICFSKKTLCLVGDSVTDGGAPYFKPSLTKDSIVFKDLKNSNGTRKRTVLEFSTYKIFDAEPNSNEANANDLKEFGKVSEGITFAGVLDKEYGVNADGDPVYDFYDYYKFYLTSNDSVSITASNQGNPFSLIFYGPCKNESAGCNYDSIYVDKKIDSLQTKIGYGYLPGNGGTTGTPEIFYIRIHDRATKPTPYLITVKVK